MTASHQLLSIPLELRQLNQWVCTKADKNLFQVNGEQAKVNDFSTWNTFEACFNAIGINDFVSVGLVLTDFDPYFIIDLDKTDISPERASLHRRIHDDFDTFSEISISGTGCHIVGKGSLITNDGKQGFKNKEWGVECYWSRHYLVFTGNVYSNKPIADRQDLLEKLYKTFAPNKSSPEKLNGSTFKAFEGNDADVIAKICSAVNGDKFKELYEQGYPSTSDRSSVDITFMNFMAFHNVGEQQAIRLIMNSKLGIDRATGPAEKRKKFQRGDYLPNTYRNAVSNPLATIPPINFEGFKEALEKKLALNGHASVAQLVEPAAHNSKDTGSNPVASTIPLPQGLMGEIAQFIYDAAPRPVPEIAIAASIGLMAGICGRAYNISGTGLNQYVLCLAMTGAGKEAMSSGIDKIIHEVMKIPIPWAPEFIGPSRIASGQALYKYMANKSQCFVSVIGEFGKRLEAMSSKGANSAEKQLIAELLDLYNKSGYGQTSKPSIYSDQDKNTLTIPAPAFSILGESTPSTFYSILNESMISDGLLPRFMLIEYNGPRPESNENHLNVYPSQHLISKIADLMSNVKTVMASNRVVNVERDERAAKLLKEFDKLADKQINNTDSETIQQLWNRAHIKVLKIAALLAVGRNYMFPQVNEDDVLWARNVVENDIRALSKKFDSGTIGRSSEEIKRHAHLKRMIVAFVKDDWNTAKKYCKDQRLHSEKIIPFHYLSSRLAPIPVFKDFGGSKVLYSALQVFIDSGFIAEYPKHELSKKYGFNQKAYQITNMGLVDEKD